MEGAYIKLNAVNVLTIGIAGLLGYGVLLLSAMIFRRMFGGDGA